MKQLFTNPKTAIYAAGFFFSIQLAITAYIDSSFLAAFVGARYTGLLYSVASALGIGAVLLLPRVLRRFGLHRFIPFFCIVSGLMSFGLSQAVHVHAVVVYFVVWLVSNSLIVVALDALLEDFSDSRTTGTTRGAYLGIINVAWLFSPLLSGKLFDLSGYSGIYMAGTLLMIPVFLIALLRFRHFRDPDYQAISLRTSLKAIRANKNLSRIIAANFLLQAFYVVMTIYTPIYLHSELGFSWNSIGIMFTFMLLPFVLLEFPLGRLSDRIGEKNILIAGFLVAAGATAAVGFIGNASVALWAIVLFATRVGACAIEIMTESYFFKTVTGSDANLISVFRTLSPAAYIIVPSIASLVLLFAPIQTIFVGMGLSMILGIGICSRLIDRK
jgi:MFS family permease